MQTKEITIEMFNSAFDELVSVKTEILRRDPSEFKASGYDDAKF